MAKNTSDSIQSLHLDKYIRTRSKYLVLEVVNPNTRKKIKVKNTVSEVKEKLEPTVIWSLSKKDLRTTCGIVQKSYDAKK